MVKNTVETMRSNCKKCRIIFVETYSPFQLVVLLPIFITAGRIYFHYKPFPPQREIGLIKRIVLKAIRLINPKAEIKSIEHDLILEENWKCNHEAAIMVKAAEKRIASLIPCGIVRKLIQDAAVIKCFQSYLVSALSSKLLFYRSAEILTKKMSSDDKLIVLPSGSLRIFHGELLKERIHLRATIPRSVIVCNKIRRMFFSVLAIPVFFFAPVIWMLLNLKRISFNKSIITAPIAVPIMHGFSNSKIDTRTGFKKNSDDNYLYNDAVVPGDIVHIWDGWTLPVDKKKNSKKIMTERRIPFAERKKYAVGISNLWYALILQIKMLRWLPYIVAIARADVELLYCGFTVIRFMLDQNVEFENVDYKVYYRLDDYSSRHIICTIMSEKIGRRVVLKHHAATTWDLPKIGFVHAHAYVVYGEIYEHVMDSFWKDVCLERTGRANIDWVAEIMRNPEEIVRLKDKFQKKYGKRRSTVLIIFPGANNRFTFLRQWNEMFSALKELTQRDLDVSVVLRFRLGNRAGPTTIEAFDHIKEFLETVYSDPMFIIEKGMFTTQELMAISDVIIAHSSSFAINEALAASAKVFTFDLTGTASYYYPDYGRDFILYKKEDILRVFEAIETDFSTFDVDWDRLRRDANYYTDGGNLDRLRKVLLDSVKEVDNRRMSNGSEKIDSPEAMGRV